MTRASYRSIFDYLERALQSLSSSIEIQIGDDMAEKEQASSTEPTPSSETAPPAVGDRPVHPNESDEIVTNYLKGWSLHVVTIALCLAHFLSSLEVSIVATSLVAITDDLRGFSESSWIVTAYLLTYTGFLIIWAKLSDIFGRKLLVIASLCLFVIFSGACGAAQSITQLIIFRALQGIGGAGTYSLVVVIFFELVPPEKFAPYTSMVSVVLAISVLLGPLLGGAINNYTTWRWVFLLNVPAGVVAIILLLIAIPTNFPRHGLPPSSYKPLTLRQSFSKTQFNRVDFLGTTLLLSATILLVSALEEAGTQYKWRSVFVIVVLLMSGLSWIAFLAWSWKITRAATAREPIFPWRFMQSRVRIGLIVSIFLTGGPFTVAVIQIPQRFQTVNNMSPLGAGIRLLPFALLCAIGSVVTASVAGKAKVPPIYLMLGGSIIQIVGFALLSTAPETTSISNAQYGYEAIAGFAVGINLCCLIVMTPFTVEKRDKSVAMSAMIQFRNMGGAIGLAIVTTVINSYIRNRLAEILPPDQIGALLQTTDAFAALSPALAEVVKSVFARGYTLQLRIMIGFSAAQVPVTFLMWQKKQIIV